MFERVMNVLIVCFLVGVALHSFFADIQIPSTVLLSVILGASVLMVLVPRVPIVLCLLSLVSLLLGILRFSQTVAPEISQVFDPYITDEEKYALRGRIVSDPDRGINRTQFVLQTEALRVDDVWTAKESRVLVSTSSYFTYHYGDVLEVYGKLERPEAFETESGRIFRYDEYLFKDKIYYLLSYAQIQVIDVQKDRGIAGRLYELKHRLLYGIDRYVPRPESGLLAGILFGEKSRLSDEIEDQFRIVGLMHIVVLSGYNVSIVIYGLMYMLRFLPLPFRSVMAVLGIIAFAIITGAGPTVVRASIMALFIVLSKLLGRKYHVQRALFLAGFIMVLWNPRILYFDISFQLSFLATYGLIVFSPYFEEKLHFLPSFALIRESAVTTLSAQVFVLPLLLYAIGEFSVVSIFVNILVLFAVPSAMLFGFIVSLCALFNPFLSSCFAFITTILLRYQLTMVRFFSELPFARIWFPPFHWSIMLTLYLIIFFWMYKLSLREKELL